MYFIPQNLLHLNWTTDPNYEWRLMFWRFRNPWLAFAGLDHQARHRDASLSFPQGSAHVSRK